MHKRPRELDKDDKELVNVRGHSVRPVAGSCVEVAGEVEGLIEMGEGVDRRSGVADMQAVVETACLRCLKKALAAKRGEAAAQLLRRRKAGSPNQREDGWQLTRRCWRSEHPE